MKNITSEKELNQKLILAYSIMKKGEKNLSERDFDKLASLSNSIAEYENKHFPFPLPKTINEMIELKMFEKKMNRGKLAKVLGIGAPKLSQILNNKRKPDILFLKAIHEKLGVDGNFILQTI